MPIAKLIERKSLIGKSGVEYMDWYLNQYECCAHGCKYCWSRILKRCSYEEWLLVKVVFNIFELMDVELPRYRDIIHRLWIGNSTDSYQPIEKGTYQTQAVVKRCIEENIRFTILTKSDLVLRDIPLFETYDKCCIGLTITCYDDSIRIKWEPNASSIDARINAVKTLKEHGIKTWVNIEPLLPFSEPTKIVHELKDYADWWVIGKLNYAKITDVHYKQRCYDVIRLAKELKLNYYVKKELRNYLGLNRPNKTILEYCKT